MRLRALIEGRNCPPIHRPTPATVAILATVEGVLPKFRPSVATVATVATLPEPERWADMMRGLAVDGVRLDLAAAILDSLMDAGTIERALILGWDARELIGLQRVKPHDDPSRAGLVYSMRPSDAVSDIRDTGCAIAIAGTNVRHLWRRVPLPADRSICLPWELGESGVTA
jgi:hypothetical protein